MSQRQKTKPTRADKASFFQMKATPQKAREGAEQDGGPPRSREGSPTSPASPATNTEDQPLTVATMR
ncbi:Hypothetical predicted protein, partial [Pelobates cultripes]